MLLLGVRCRAGPVGGAVSRCRRRLCTRGFHDAPVHEERVSPICLGYNEWLWEATFANKLPTFDPKRHRYTSPDGKEMMSVTRLVGSLFEKFDPNATLDRFYDRWQQDSSNQYFGKSKREIKDMWANKGKAARDDGTAMHAGIEKFFLDGDLSWFEENKSSKAEAEQFLCFLDASEEAEWVANPLSVEQPVMHTELKLAGTVDFIGRCPSGDPKKVVLVDWKRSSKPLGPDERHYNRTAKAPLDRLVFDTTFSKYSLQLNLYARILQDVYGLETSGMMLVQLSPEIENFRTVQVPLLKPEIDLVVGHRENQL